MSEKIRVRSHLSSFAKEILINAYNEIDDLRVCSDNLADYQVAGTPGWASECGKSDAYFQVLIILDRVFKNFDFDD